MSTEDDPLPILLVEDDRADAYILCKIIERHAAGQFQVEHVSLVQEGLAKLATQTYGLVLLDLSLPDSSGLTSLQEVRQAAPHTPVVVLTGLDDQEVAMRTLRSGAQDYLIKGEYQEEDLVRSIRYAIERHRSQEMTNLPKLRVLLVEDNLVTRKVESHILEEKGFVVTATSTPEQALGHLRQEAFDCLLTDYDLPGMDGPSLIRQARTIRSAARIPMIILSSRDQPGDDKTASAAGADHHFLKQGLDFAKLAAIIRALAARSRTELPGTGP